MNGQIPSITGVILVGGKSRSMGTDKAFLEIEGEPIFERVLRAMSANFASVLLIGDKQERFSGYGLPVIADRYPGSALGGLYTGLLSADTDLIYVSPCDLPFPSASLIRHLCSLANGFDTVVPKTEKGFEPLFALYRKSCLEPMRHLLEQGNYRVYDIYPEVTVRFVSAEELNLVTDLEHSLLNINTPAEYAKMKRELTFPG
jgi:molybdopterin-guanine dinucleotide biosynthesis protein A